MPRVRFLPAPSYHLWGCNSVVEVSHTPNITHQRPRILQSLLLTSTPILPSSARFAAGFIFASGSPEWLGRAMGARGAHDDLVRRLDAFWCGSDVHCRCVQSFASRARRARRAAHRSPCSPGTAPLHPSDTPPSTLSQHKFYMQADSRSEAVRGGG